MIMQPYHTELAAGTMNPATFLRCLGPREWRTAYVEPVIRPTDGRYGENPFRFSTTTSCRSSSSRAPTTSSTSTGARSRRSGSTSRGTTRASSRTTGSSRRSAHGARLGGLAGRDGDHPVHLLPAARGDGRRPGSGGDHLRDGAPGDVPPGQGQRARESSGHPASRGATSTATASASSRPTTSRRPPSTCSCATSTTTRRSAGGSWSSACRCPRTTRC